MGYNAIDIIDKSIEIENFRNDLLQKILNESHNIPNKNICSNVLSSEIKRRIKILNDLKKNLSIQSLNDIDIITYDKISFLINEFNKRKYIVEVNSIQEYLDFSLNLLYDKRALFIDVQGRIASNSLNFNKESYDLVSEIIKLIDKQIEIVNSVHI